MTTSNIWNAETVKYKIRSSDAWVARAIFRLSLELTPDKATDGTTSLSDDLMFFINLRIFFVANGFFTDRHIAIARKKIRDPYIEYLVSFINK